MVVAILSKDNFLKKLGLIIKECRSKQDNYLCLVFSENFYDEFFSILKSDHRVASMTINKNTIFLIEEMRVELKKIDGYV